MKKALIIIGIVISLLALFVWYRLQSMPELYKERAVLENRESDNEVWQVKEYLETNLNDPESYEPVYWGELEKVDSTQFEGSFANDPGYVVSHTFRAKNAFSGTIKADKVFIIGKDGYVLAAIDRNEWDMAQMFKKKINYFKLNSL